ncbi:uncharacterized protein HMPREF1541_04325 [Cyphellophora europaea CBS 101466]|uniref:MICOS complex subunit MIC12 n=1 Tax=Cyphellophora europaea (strain CBS 101466) TaxID=1220924 RepID=W2RUR9_CYPE1|nr:uncharacterized protein HMPREF1541_04325 [Cyphellophora europaea CBS 101466]ETN40050.1 hypothetical protein HMPREF1541_04325 [Cyphellophora europaea CBS 101466]
MGFTTGFLGGFTLTTGVLYLTIYLHKANRNVQHTILQQSSQLLHNVVEPPAPRPDPPPYEVKRAGLSEQLKDRWNSELEKMVSRIQTTDWTEQREIYTDKITNAWNNLRQTEQVKELEQKAKEAVDSAKDGAKDIVDSAKSETKDKVEAAKEKSREPRLLEMR